MLVLLVMRKSNFVTLCTASMLLLLSLTLFFQSCEKKEKSVDTEEVAEEQNEAKFDNDTTGVDNDNKEADAEFLTQVTATDLTEIELGKLAQKSANLEIKALGDMMVSAHTTSATEVELLASAKNISVPAALTEDGKEAFNSLNEKKAADFDKAYADKMVNEHETTIKTFEDYLKEGTDPEIKAWASKALPLLKVHLQHAKEVKAKLK